MNPGTAERQGHVAPGTISRQRERSLALRIGISNRLQGRVVKQAVGRHGSVVSGESPSRAEIMRVPGKVGHAPASSTSNVPAAQSQIAS